MGSLKNERLLIQVRCRSERSSINAYQIWARGTSWEFLPFLAVIPIGQLPAITIANENSNVGHHGMG